jgi:mycofactocin precursor
VIGIVRHDGGVPVTTLQEARVDDTQSQATVDVAEREDSGADALVLADLLVEEVSIDGMCGVY